MKTTLTLAITLALGLYLSPTTRAQDAGKVDFEKQVLPILKESCFKCHEKEHEDGGKIKKPKGGLRLDHRDSAIGSVWWIPRPCPWARG